MTHASPLGEGHPVSPGAPIVTRDLTKVFGQETAVQSIDMEVAAGTIVGLIGPSGCGKTTTVRLLTGLYPPTSGDVTVLGHTPARFPRAVRERIGYMPQLFVLYPELTVWENLNFAASIYGVGLRRRDLLQGLLEFVELWPHRKKLVNQISGGMRRRLALAATFVHNPSLVFLDEPTAGIDPVLRRKIWDYFRELQKDGRTFLVTTQYVGEAAHCDQVGVMDEGRLLMLTTPEELRRRAFGGDVVTLRTATPLINGEARRVSLLPFVEERVDQVNSRTLRLVVDDAGTAVPALMEWATGEGLKVETIEEYLPPFDDVFVELLRREKQHA